MDVENTLSTLPAALVLLPLLRTQPINHLSHGRGEYPLDTVRFGWDPTLFGLRPRRIANWTPSLELSNPYLLRILVVAIHRSTFLPEHPFPSFHCRCMHVLSILRGFVEESKCSG